MPSSARNLLPFLAMDNIQNIYGTNAEPARESCGTPTLRSSSVQSSNLDDFAVSKFRATVIFPKTGISKLLPSFLNHIRYVILLSSLEKMIWIYARWIIAMVKNIENREPSAIDYEARYVGINGSVRASPSSTNAAVTKALFASCPKPTLPQVGHVRRNRSILIDLRPESFSERIGKTLRQCRVLSKYLHTVDWSCPLALQTRRAFSFCLFLASIATIHAQPLTVGDPAFVGVYPSGGFTPAQLVGVRYWWRFEDNPTNTAVTNWVDRIAGLILTNGAASHQPTNSSTGVGFVGTTWLTNTSPFSITCGAPGCQDFSGTATNGSLWVIIAPQSSALSGVVTENSAGGNGLFTVATRQLEWFGNLGSTVFGNYTAGQVLDIGCCITNSGTIQNRYYTNGVLGAASADAIQANPEKNAGSYGAQGGTSPFNGKILDIVYTTNYLSQAQITQLHTYAQTRGVSP